MSALWHDKLPRRPLRQRQLQPKAISTSATAVIRAKAAPTAFHLPIVCRSSANCGPLGAHKAVRVHDLIAKSIESGIRFRLVRRILVINGEHFTEGAASATWRLRVGRTGALSRKN